jgi:hypothetical protein
MSVTLDFNRANLSENLLNTLINQLIEQAEPPRENNRQYLGASAIGSECLRKVQYDWMCDRSFRRGYTTSSDAGTSSRT